MVGDAGVGLAGVDEVFQVRDWCRFLGCHSPYPLGDLALGLVELGQVDGVSVADQHPGLYERLHGLGNGRHSDIRPEESREQFDKVVWPE